MYLELKYYQVPFLIHIHMQIYGMKHLGTLASDLMCGLLTLTACLWFILHSCCCICWSDLTPCLFVLLTSLSCLISSCLYFLSLLCPVLPQCTQGTKGLLESATRSPLLSTPCPQGKPQSSHTCPDNSPGVNSDPSPELSTSCGARHTISSSGDTSPPRHTKTRSKKNKRAALHISNSAFDDPASPTSPDVGTSYKGRGQKGAMSAPLHWLTWMTAFSSENTHCSKLACCYTVRFKWYELLFFSFLFVGFLIAGFRNWVPWWQL